MTSLKDKVALITGASSGIGSGIAKHFAALGCRLSLNGRKEENLKKVEDECVALGLARDKILLVVGDLSDDDTLKNIFKKTIEHFGQLDCLVNNAGMVVFGTIETIDMEGYDRQMNVNLRAQYHLTHLAVPHLKKTKGTIVNISSIGGLRSFPNLIAYCMSKAALDQMTRCAAVELGGYGIRVNSVNPGLIDTDIYTRGGMQDQAYDQARETTKTTYPLGRPGTVDEVAKCVTFLASDDSTFITGTTIPIDGGRTCKS